MEHLSRTYPLDEPISPSSLLPPHLHHPHLVELQQIPVNWDIIDYCIEYIVAFLLPFRPDVPRHRLKTSFFAHVACNVVSRSETEIGTLLVALSFINRAGDAFAKNRHLDLGKPWDAEDLFIAALMLANKAVDDSPYPLSYWEAWTTVMNKKTLCTLERHFLMLIDYDIKVKEEELLRHYDGVMQYCIRERGGWHRLMDLLRSDAVERDDQPPPRQHPAPIGTGRPRGDAPQQPRAGPPSERRPEASSSARPYPEYRQAERPPSQYARAQHPAAPPPSARHPPPEARAYEPPAPWQAEGVLRGERTAGAAGGRGSHRGRWWEEER
ncbi:hypothetical protein EVJ58_g4762 [Rhodofomes roseus]|uniref:Cyclin N-terminal domain-containing protein n=1 Tax=Rhodofomes roseus TaxID=34475 RepID=A0A4Y9YGN8_9APHY|nr:hypothetical protein EVJ58_g4762 [Rhodofomes roseus]